MDVIQDENTEDIKKMAAIIPSDEDYMKTSVWSLVAHRPAVADAADDLRNVYFDHHHPL